MNGGELTRELVEASAAFGERSARAERIAAAIRRYGDYRWVGIYDVGRDEIAVDASAYYSVIDDDRPAVRANLERRLAKHRQGEGETTT